jgi:hypothetical protein
MPSPSAIFDMLGFATPFAWAGLVYGLFEYLDRNASAQANSAMSGWLKRGAYRNIDLKAAFVSAFDHLYTSPLLRLRAFLRSSLISATVFLLWLIDTVPISSLYAWLIKLDFTALSALITGLFFVVCSDYISLFVIRFLITNTKGHSG